MFPCNNYTSVFKINGTPIIPPLITDDIRLQIKKYKNEAIKIESKLKKLNKLDIPGRNQLSSKNRTTYVIENNQENLIVDEITIEPINLQGIELNLPDNSQTHRIHTSAKCKQTKCSVSARDTECEYLKLCSMLNESQPQAVTPDSLKRYADQITLRKRSISLWEDFNNKHTDDGDNNVTEETDREDDNNTKYDDSENNNFVLLSTRSTSHPQILQTINDDIQNDSNDKNGDNYENQNSVITPPHRLIRSNSYTLDKPSPMLVKHIMESKGVNIRPVTSNQLSKEIQNVKEKQNEPSAIEIRNTKKSLSNKLFNSKKLLNAIPTITMYKKPKKSPYDTGTVTTVKPKKQFLRCSTINLNNVMPSNQTARIGVKSNQLDNKKQKNDDVVEHQKLQNNQNNQTNQNNQNNLNAKKAKTFNKNDVNRNKARDGDSKSIDSLDIVQKTIQLCVTRSLSSSTTSLSSIDSSTSRSVFNAQNISSPTNIDDKPTNPVDNANFSPTHSTNNDELIEFIKQIENEHKQQIQYLIEKQQLEQQKLQEQFLLQQEQLLKQINCMLQTQQQQHQQFQQPQQQQQEHKEEFKMHNTQQQSNNYQQQKQESWQMTNTCQSKNPDNQDDDTTVPQCSQFSTSSMVSDQIEDLSLESGYTESELPTVSNPVNVVQTLNEQNVMFNNPVLDTNQHSNYYMSAETNGYYSTRGNSPEKLISNLTYVTNQDDEIDKTIRFNEQSSQQFLAETSTVNGQNSARKCHRKLFYYESSDDQYIEPNLENITKIKAATIINAYVRGYLVRRLFRTEQVQLIVQTIRDTLVFVLNLHYETINNNQTSETSADQNLKINLLQQLNSACISLNNVFHEKSAKEKMLIIAKDRAILKRRLSKTPISTSRHNQRKSTTSLRSIDIQSKLEKMTLFSSTIRGNVTTVSIPKTLPANYEQKRCQSSTVCARKLSKIRTPRRSESVVIRPTATNSTTYSNRPKSCKN